MKKKIFFAFILIVAACSFDSCTNTCKTCKKVYYDSNGVKTGEDSAAEYCGIELAAIDGKTIDLGAMGSAKWDCN